MDFRAKFYELPKQPSYIKSYVVLLSDFKILQSWTANVIMTGQYMAWLSLVFPPFFSTI